MRPGWPSSASRWSASTTTRRRSPRWPRAGCPFHEPGLPELLRRHVESGRLRFTTSLREAAEVADVHFVCVGHAAGSRRGRRRQPRARVGRGAGARCCGARRWSSGSPRSRSAPRRSLPGASRTSSPLGVDVGLAWNPEFLREGYAVHDTLHPNRIVLGTTDPAAERTLREVYATPIAAGTPVVVTDLPTAELVKVSANAFLATKISFINAMAELCEATGADVTLLSEALGPRRADRPAVPRSGLGLRRWLPAQGHPRPDRAGRRDRTPRVGRLPALRRPDQPAPARPRRGDGGGTGRVVPGRPHRRARCRLQARLRRRPRLARARRGPPARGGGGARHRLRPGREPDGPRGRAAAAVRGQRGHGLPEGRPGAAPDRVGGVPRARPRGARIASYAAR